jgi:hypothetical protein
MYHQIGVALLVPTGLKTVLNRWPVISRILAEPPRKRARHTFY